MYIQHHYYRIVMAKFATIKEYIYQKIESGEWPEYHPVSSENALAERFSVSRMTARRALQELCEEGLVTRTRGSGTFVAPLKSQSALLTIRNIADEIALRNHRHHAEVKTLVAEVAPNSVATALQLPVGTEVWHSIIVHYENGQPVQVEDRFVNPTLVPEYLAQDYTQATPHEYLCAVTPLTEASHLIEAVLPSPELMALLQISAGEPCLQIQRRTSCREGVVSQATLTHPGSRFRLGGHMKFNGRREA